MRTVSRRGFSSGLLVLIAGACGGQVEETDPSAPDPMDPPAFDPPSADPVDLGLAFAPVTTFAVPTMVWSWTTAEQAADVRAGGVLFTVESSPTMGRGFLFDVLQMRADAGDAVAARLVGPELLKGRFGWSNPWATVRGATDGESYGLELLSITMKPDTIYALVRASAGDIGFVDGTGKFLAHEDALAAYDRVGGILFDNDTPSNRQCGTLGQIGSAEGGGNMLYREIYLGNEAQIASFSHKTQAILDAITSSRAELVTLRDALAAVAESTIELECDAWRAWRSGPQETSLGRYLASLAFATPLYTPTVANLNALLAELDKARFVPDPFIVTP